MKKPILHLQIQSLYSKTSIDTRHSYKPPPPIRVNLWPFLHLFECYHLRLVGMDLPDVNTTSQPNHFVSCKPATSQLSNNQVNFSTFFSLSIHVLAIAIDPSVSTIHVDRTFHVPTFQIRVLLFALCAK